LYSTALILANAHAHWSNPKRGQTLRHSRRVDDEKMISNQNNDGNIHSCKAETLQNYVRDPFALLNPSDVFHHLFSVANFIIFLPIFKSAAARLSMITNKTFSFFKHFLLMTVICIRVS